MLARFEALQNRFPEHATACTYAGEALVWSGRYQEAAAQFERAIAIDATTTWAWIGLGASALLTGDPERALAVFARGVEMCDYEGPTLFLYRAEARWAVGERAAARSDIDRALVSKPQRLSAWVLRALFDAEEGDSAHAAELCERLRTAAPGLWADAGGRGDPVPVLRAVRAMMRGNRSSSLVTYFAGDALRFGRWRRSDAPDWPLHPGAPSVRTRPQVPPGRCRSALKTAGGRGRWLACGRGCRSRLMASTIACSWLGIRRRVARDPALAAHLEEVAAVTHDLGTMRRDTGLCPSLMGLRKRWLPLVAALRAHSADPLLDALLDDVDAWCATNCWWGLARHVFASAELSEQVGEELTAVLLGRVSMPRRASEVPAWRPLLVRLRAAAGDNTVLVAYCDAILRWLAAGTAGAIRGSPAAR